MHHSHIDRFAHGDSPLHRLDPRAKLLAVLGYTVVLISFDRYSIAAVVPMAAAPLGWLVAARVPLWFAFRRVLVLSPFILMLALMGPLYDRSMHAAAIGGWRFAISGGWLTACNVGLKFALGVMALTALMCTTTFASLGEAMARLGVPKILVMQLGMVYRYIFELIDQSMRIRRARDFRGASRAGLSRRLAAAGGIVGSLFVRTLERSQRVQLAMSARGYTGQPHSLTRLRFSLADGLFLAGLVGYLVFCRLVYPAMLVAG